MLRYKTSLSTLKKTEILSKVFSDNMEWNFYNDVEINKKTGKITNMWKLNNVLLNNMQLNNYEVNKEIRGEIKNTEDENTEVNSEESSKNSGANSTNSKKESK